MRFCSDSVAPPLGNKQRQQAVSAGDTCGQVEADERVALRVGLDWKTGHFGAVHLDDGRELSLRQRLASGTVQRHRGADFVTGTVGFAGEFRLLLDPRCLVLGNDELPLGHTAVVRGQSQRVFAPLN